MAGWCQYHFEDRSMRHFRAQSEGGHSLESFHQDALLREL